MAQSSLVKPTPPKRDWVRGFSKPGIAAKGGHNRASYSGNLPADLRRIRTETILQLKVQGWTHPQIAAELNCSTDTIRRAIKRARTEGKIEQFGHDLFKALVPAATAVIEHHLAEKSLKAAELVFRHAGQLLEIKERRELAEDMSRVTPQAPEDTLEAFYQRYLTQQAAEAVDGQLVTTEDPATDNSTPDSQASVDASSDAGYGAADLQGAEEAPASTGPHPSEDRPAPHEDVSDASRFDSDRADSPSAQGGV